jgi:hypothetical protein
MRYLVGFVFVLAALPVLGCGDECMRPLGDFHCISRDSCPTYDELINDERGIWVAIRCEDTELVLWSRNIDGGGRVLYFDESKMIVAAEQFGYEFSHCGGQILYGPVPDCPDEQWWRGSYVID